MRIAAAFLMAVSGLAFPAALPAAEPPARASGLTLHAGFDEGPDADFARGDPRLHSASSGRRLDARPGLPANRDVLLAPGEGRRGGALRFVKPSETVVFFHARGNLKYLPDDWRGTVSFWLKVDPDAGPVPAYTDPLHITERGWDDGALWVDFSKDDTPRHLRLGAFPDRKVWNPAGRDPDKIPVAERPMFDAGKPPFSAARWSHVAFTFDHFNTGKADGVATLYLDGRRQGAITGWTQTVTWDPSRAAVTLGMNYTGLLDELALFDRPLDDAEILALYRAGGLPGAAADTK